jgi:hypothetical protein
MIRHVVVFKFKPQASQESVQHIVSSFKNLPDKIEDIIDFEYGINNSPENLNMGFTHVFILTFRNAEGRDNYLSHPEHQTFTALLNELGVLDNVFVVDYQVDPS